jgi:hypothetical protein
VKGIVIAALARVPGGRAAFVPAIIVWLPVEGPAVARVEAASWEDERRVELALADRASLLDAIAEALVELADAVDEEASK